MDTEVRRECFAHWAPMIWVCDKPSRQARVLRTMSTIIWCTAWWCPFNLFYFNEKQQSQGKKWYCADIGVRWYCYLLHLQYPCCAKIIGCIAACCCFCATYPSLAACVCRISMHLWYTGRGRLMWPYHDLHNGGGLLVGLLQQEHNTPILLAAVLHIGMHYLSMF